MKVWVKFPDKPNVKTMITCLQSIVKNLQKEDPNKHVTGIRINSKERAFEIDIESDGSG